MHSNGVAATLGEKSISVNWTSVDFKGDESQSF